MALVGLGGALAEGWSVGGRSSLDGGPTEDAREADPLSGVPGTKG